MQGVCSSPGCYDRAKLEINTQGNANDARYAIQVSTTSNFSSSIFTIAGTTHIMKNNSTVALSDFLFKCDWEGTVLGSFCASPNTTWQKYNILGLVPGTQYYFRISGLKGSTTNGSFTQSAWSPIVTATTAHTSISFKIDIGPSSSSTSSPPYILSVNDILPNTITTSTNYMIFRTTSNALNGVQVQVKGQNGSLLNGANTIPGFSGNLSTQTNGYGIRNDSTTNSQINGGSIGNIHISTTPIDFTDPGGTPNQVGAPTTSFNNLFDSQSLPLNTGVSAYKVKVVADLTKPTGNYTETLTALVYGTY